MALSDAIIQFTDRLRAGVPGTNMEFRRGVPYTFITGQGPASCPEELTAKQMWQTQPHLRTVVDFIAMNIGQLSLHPYRQKEDGPARIRTGALAVWCRKPNRAQTMSEFITDLVGDRVLHNRAYVWVTRGKDGPETWVLPVEHVTAQRDLLGRPRSYQVASGDVAHELSAAEVIEFRGYTPGSGREAVSPVEALRLILAEQFYTWEERKTRRKRGGLFQGFFMRPADAGEWDDTARRRFNQYRRDYGPGGVRAGEDMILEDGMSYKQLEVNSKNDEWARSVELSLATVCQVYNVNPTMIGAGRGGSYASVKEFRKALYTETLGPYLKELESRFSLFVLPLIGATADEYVEFNVGGKLRGSFEEQAKVTTQSVGGPWMTRNEARARNGLARIEGGDELIVPLNVLIGGQSSPLDGGEGRPEEKSAVLSKFLDRQHRVISARKGAGKPWWDEARWVRELSADLDDETLAREIVAATKAAYDQGARPRLADLTIGGGSQ